MSKFIRMLPVRQKNVPQPIGISRGGRTMKIHWVVADENLPIARRLSSGSSADDPEWQVLIKKSGGDSARQTFVIGQSLRWGQVSSEGERVRHASGSSTEEQSQQAVAVTAKSYTSGGMEWSVTSEI